MSKHFHPGAVPPEDTTLETSVRWVALIALFLVPLTPFLVANSYFFPFITGKAYFFRILAEVATVAWILLAFLNKDYRPRFSWIGVAVTALVVWMFIADAFAPNAVKAFWSNFERMEGWVWLVHLLGFFFAASSVLRVTRLWRAWFLTALGYSCLIVGYALLQLNGTYAIHQGSTRIDATLGNSAYFAVYLLLMLFVALWLALTERYEWLKYTLLSLAVVDGILIFFTETRGTMIGLVVALAVAALLTIWTAGKRARGAAVVGLVCIVIAVGGVYLGRTSDLVQKNSILQRATSISLADGQVRFMLWHMAWEGFLDRPLVGWGQEGYNYVFNTYYDPGLYHQEQWFDRAHGVFIDWLVAGGFPAFLLYLALFGSAVVLLWRTSSLSRPERVVLTAAFVGYAIHNIFVFDNLSSYIFFFSLLALIDSQVGKPIAFFEDLPVVNQGMGVVYLLPVGVVFLGGLVWSVNVPGMTVAQGLSGALVSSTFDTALATFEDLAQGPEFARQEVREQLVSFAAQVSQVTGLTNEQKLRAANSAIGEMQKQITRYPRDTREILQLAYIYRVYGDQENALRLMSVAEQQSPKKIDLLLTEGMTAWDAGALDKAQQFFERAYALAPEFPDLAEYVAAGAIVTKDQEKADRLLEKVYGTTTVDSPILSMAYVQVKDWDRVIALWERNVARPDSTIQSWFTLASAYYTAGRTQKALNLITTIKEKFPDSGPLVDEALKRISTGS